MSPGKFVLVNCVFEFTFYHLNPSYLTIPQISQLGRSKLIICSTSSFNKKFEGGGDFIQTNIKKQTYKIYIINLIKTYRE